MVSEGQQREHVGFLTLKQSELCCGKMYFEICKLFHISLTPTEVSLRQLTEQEKTSRAL